MLDRRSIRLPSYDYSQRGAYFVTIVTANRRLFLGSIRNDHVTLSPFGKIVQTTLSELPRYYPRLSLDASVIMPNHVHAVLVLENALGDDLVGRTDLKSAPTSKPARPISEIVRAFKAFSTREVNTFRGAPGSPLWQRNYYEHVIRNDADLNKIREYIHYNPTKWSQDQENPYRLPPPVYGQI